MKDDTRGIGGIWEMDPATGLRHRPAAEPAPADPEPEHGLQDEAADDPGQD
jgi:hypothetical protein